MVVHTCKPSTWEVEARASGQLQATQGKKTDWNTWDRIWKHKQAESTGIGEREGCRWSPRQAVRSCDSKKKADESLTKQEILPATIVTDKWFKIKKKKRKKILSWVECFASTYKSLSWSLVPYKKGEEPKCLETEAAVLSSKPTFVYKASPRPVTVIE